MEHPSRGPGLHIDRVRSGYRKGRHNVSLIGKNGELKWRISGDDIAFGIVAIGLAGIPAILGLLPKK